MLDKLEQAISQELSAAKVETTSAWQKAWKFLNTPISQLF